MDRRRRLKMFAREMEKEPQLDKKDFERQLQYFEAVELPYVDGSDGRFFTLIMSGMDKSPFRFAWNLRKHYAGQGFYADFDITEGFKKLPSITLEWDRPPTSDSVSPLFKKLRKDYLDSYD